MSRKYVRIAAVALVVATALSACGASDSDTGSGDGLPQSIPVTLVGDMTGFAAQYGKSYREGAEIATKEVNDSDLLGGSQLKLTVEDTGSDVKTASAKVSGATRGDAVAILGPTLSNEAVAVAPIAQRAKIPYLSNESSKGTENIGEYVYNMSPNQVQQAPTLAKYISAKSSSVALIYANDNPAMSDLKSGLAVELKKAGCDVVGEYGTPIAATDFTALVTEALSKSPDAIGILGGGAMMPGIINQLRNSGYKGTLFGNMGADGSLGSSGTSAEGFTYVTQWVLGMDSPKGKKFAESYTSAYPKSVPIYTAMDGYESITMVALALEEAQSTDPGAVLAGLQSVAKSGFTSPSGSVTFDGNGRRQKVTPGLIVEFRGGEPIPQN